jgi:SAM-dependent methyltransferase
MNPETNDTRFHDHFSTLAAVYARYRPRYPVELFDFIAGLSPARECAWDCATGNGQAAEGLARYFRRVVATDASAEQIAAAKSAENIEYRVAPAENSGLPAASADVCTVAQALHWFHFERFYAEARRTVKPRGIVAVWMYGQSEITPDIDAITRDFYRRISPYFPPERRWIDERYATIPFPFDEIAAPDFFMEARWNCADILGYYSSWSAVKEYQVRHRENPLTDVEPLLRKAWQGNPEETLSVRWKLALRIGRR